MPPSVASQYRSLRRLATAGSQGRKTPCRQMWITVRQFGRSIMPCAFSSAFSDSAYRHPAQNRNRIPTTIGNIRRALSSLIVSSPVPTS